MKRTEDASYIGEPDTEGKEPFALRAKHGLGRFPILEPGEEAHEYETLWRRAFEGRARDKAPRAGLAKLLLKGASDDEVSGAFAFVEPRLSRRLR
ncbi:MAG: hypothetical protein ACRDJ5_05195, partial [Actinomycetota bacterium]